MRAIAEMLLTAAEGRRHRTWLLTLVLVTPWLLWAGGLLAIVLSTWLMWLAWKTNTWSTVWLAVMVVEGLIVPPVSLLRVRRVWHLQVLYAERVRLLCRDAAGGTVARGPLAIAQPLGANRGHGPVDEQAFRLIDPWFGRRILRLVAAVGGLGLLAMLLIALLWSVWSLPPVDVPIAHSVALSSVLLMVLCMCICLALAISPGLWWPWRTQQIQANEQVMCRLGGPFGRREIAIAWEEMRAFYCMELWDGFDFDLDLLLHKGMSARQRLDELQLKRDVLFVVDGDGRTIVWLLGRHALSAEVAKHQTLCQQIVERTGLDLRDVTMEAAVLARDSQGYLQRGLIGG